MKVLVTGGAGFIGSHVAERLLARGDSVLVLDNYKTGRRDNLKPHTNLTIVEGTIADDETVKEAFERLKPDKVVHAAASYKDPNNWEEDARTNVLGTAIIVQACQVFNVQRLIYFQTALCYGLRPKEQPITLNSPINPRGSSYAISKTAGELYIELSGLEYISFRLANAYGPRNMSGPLPTFYHRLSENKSCFVMDTRRDFLYIEDLLKVVMMALDGKGSHGAYHVSSGRDHSIKELFDAIVKAMGIRLDREVEVRPRSAEDAYTILLDPSKTNGDFGWKTSTPLEAGVRAAIDYYKAHGVTETYTHLNIEKGKR